MTLLEKIRQKQQDIGSQAEFAKQLGMSESQVSLVLSGKRGVGKKFLDGLVNAYPEFYPDVLVFLLPNLTETKGIIAEEQT